MNGNKTGYIVALVAAVLVLFGSVSMAVLHASTSDVGPLRGVGDSQDWRQGPGSGPGQGMMGQRGGSGQRGGPQGGGMMGRNPGASTITAAQAKTVADQWVAANQAGAVADAGRQMPMGYAFTVTKAGATLGELMVSSADDVFFHAWNGSGTPPSASASPSAA